MTQEEIAKYNVTVTGLAGSDITVEDAMKMGYITQTGFADELGGDNSEAEELKNDPAPTPEEKPEPEAEEPKNDPAPAPETEGDKEPEGDATGEGDGETDGPVVVKPTKKSAKKKS